ncbi:phosphoribosyl-AMP cyclohydrolase [Acetobacter papayae]|uniref:phosphoribosyl-AMP cyclohydrolase n=1 Tax=Acetobacter papayae TaxID=1076592 RepID=UPI0011DC94A6|nr:phosphoribosyl-AMP cyclohydrolase [Acetobacter papayae]
MVGMMNAEVLVLRLESHETHYWSRSSQCLWRKGTTSGFAYRQRSACGLVAR